MGGRSRRAILRPTVSCMSSPPRAEIGRHQIGDVQKAVAAQAEIDERGLDGRLDVGDAALVDVADVAGGAGSLHVKLFELAVFDQGDSAFLALRRR